MSSAAECEFIIGYVRASVCKADLSPWFLALPILMYHCPSHAFCMTVAVIGLVEAYQALPLPTRSSAKYALTSAAITTIVEFQKSAEQVAADIATSNT
jgi:hypothetical protein